MQQPIEPRYWPRNSRASGPAGRWPDGRPDWWTPWRWPFRAGDLAGVRPAGPGQPVLPHLVPERRPAAGLPDLSGDLRVPCGGGRRVGPRSAAAGSAAARSERPGLGGSRGAAIVVRLPGAADARRLQRVPRPAGAARRRRHRRWARCCCSWSSKPAGARRAGHCRWCARSSWATPTTAGSCPRNWAIAHTGLDFDQIVDALYNSGSGFYGTPLDVAASYIVLFTIYGAVLVFPAPARSSSICRSPRSGGRRSAAGRTAVASGFLLGTVSGSGAATTVSVGAVTWPILRRAGYPADRAGGMLAAAGVGAILSPPTLGAAAFIIAELLDVSYLQVLGWATFRPCCTTSASCSAVEIDARRFGARPVERCRRDIAVAVAAALRLPPVVAGGDRAVPGVRRRAPPARSSTPR